MSDFKCSVCDRSFDSERGLKIHFSQMHSEEEEKEASKQPDNEQDENSSILVLGVRQAVTLSFIFGLVTGLLIGTMLFMISGVGLESPLSSGDDDESESDIETISGMPYDANIGTGSENVEWNGETVELEDRPYLGDDDAPITMVSYEDFFCPFCTGFHNEDFAAANNMNSAFNDIVENHIETGEVQYYYKNLPVAGGDMPAEASECMLDHGSPEAFWDFNYEHFDNFEELQQIVETDPSEYNDIMVSWADQLDADEDAFSSCIENSETQERVSNHVDEADSLGASATPSVFINGELIEGAQPYSAFEAVIEEQ